MNRFRIRFLSDLDDNTSIIKSRFKHYREMIPNRVFIVASELDTCDDVRTAIDPPGRSLVEVRQLEDDISFGETFRL